MAIKNNFGFGKKPVRAYSDFWLDDMWRKPRDYSIWNEDEGVQKSFRHDLIQLSAYRRAISNFVEIVTGKNIPVTFESRGGQSYTDGKKVYISANLEGGEFDVAVGLALHEGSHIKLTNFKTMKELSKAIEKSSQINWIPKNIYKLAAKKGYNEAGVAVHIKLLLNYVEDRRIDNYIFSTSPGYKGYYHEMYNEYWHSKIMSKALESDSFTTETWASYEFRIINLTNSKTRFVLNGLREIWKIIDLKNIKRLKSTSDTLEIALLMYEVVLNNLKNGKIVTDKNGNSTTVPADGSKSDGSDGSNKSSNEHKKELSDDEFKDLLDSIKNGKMAQGTGGEGTVINLPGQMIPTGQPNCCPQGKPSDIELTEKQIKQLKKALEKQKKFLKGEIEKSKLDDKALADITTVEQSGMKYKEVGYSQKNSYKPGKTKCVVVDKLNTSLIDSGVVPMVSRNNENHHNNGTYTFVVDGIRLGTVLGKKLKVRNESKTTKVTRKRSGKLDKRLIAELGFQNDIIFSQTFVDAYSNANIHISVDASGSMSGDKWNKAMTATIAIAKACSMISGIDVVISLRGTTEQNNNKPLVLIAYDSKKDKFSKIKNLFRYLDANTTTPEGLCFEATMDKIVPSSVEMDSYFLNFSDGMPYFHSNEIDYAGPEAHKHTKQMINKMIAKGIKILSYYIGDSTYRSSEFIQMYGKDSRFVDVTNVVEIARTLNKKFLSKD